MTKVIPELTKRGVSVSTIKHAHHKFDVDTPGKDSFAHRSAGATEVLVTSTNRWALMHENRGNGETPLSALVERIAPVDLLLVEGFKSCPHEKLEIYRSSVQKPMLALSDNTIVAIASDEPIPGISIPFLDLNNGKQIATFIITHCNLDGNSI